MPEENMPTIGSKWQHHRTNHDTVYAVLFITNIDHRNSKHPAQVVYQGTNGSYWSRPLATWPETLFPVHEKYHLMTMGHNSVDPIYRGVVEIDDNNFVQGEGYSEDGGVPVEDFGCFYYTPESEPFPTDKEWMFNKFLSLMDDD